MFDENLAGRLAGALADIYPGSVHVGDVGLLGCSDLAIWAHAQANEFVLVSKDDDFLRLSVLYGPPPKVIWLRLGNCRTEEVVALLKKHQPDIEAFVYDPDASFLALA